MTRDELTVLARALKVSGYSNANKRALIDAILTSEPAKLRRHLQPTWWDKHQGQVYGWSSVIGLLFAVIVWLYPGGFSATGLTSWLNPGGPTAGVRQQALAGNIRDAKTREPVADARVSLPEHGIEVRSDALGRFEMQVQGPHQDSVELLARKAGFRPHEQYATLGNTSLDVDLEEDRP